jgi:MFS family permease
MASYMRTLSLGVPFKAFTRDIWILCLSNVIGAFGEGLYFWVFPIYVRSLQADYVQLGLVISALYGASALAPLPGGILADRFDRKKLLILSWTPWVFAPLLYSFAGNWTQLIPGTICWGISMIGIPALNAYIITSVSDNKNLASVLSFVWASYSFGYIFAPTVGSLLAPMIGMQWVLRFSTLLCALATAVFFLLHSQHPRKSRAEIRQQPSSVAEEKRLWRRLLFWSGFFMVITFFVTIGRTFLPTFLNEQVKLPETYIGLFGSINFAGVTFIGIGMGRLGDRWRKPRAISLCLLLYITSMVPMLLIREPVFLLSMAFLYGGSAVTNSLVSSYVGTIAPENKRGRWSSVPQTLSLLAAFAAPYLGGYLYTQSPYYTFIVSISAVPFLLAFALIGLKE